MKLDTINKMMRDLHSVNVMHRLDVDVQSMYLAFYNIHKQETGTGKEWIRDGNIYDKFMNKRYDYIFCCINEVLESKLEYRRKQDGV